MLNDTLLNRQFAIIREDIHRRYDQLHDATFIDETLDAVIAELKKTAKVETFLPVLAERETAERLEEIAEAEGRQASSRKEILFACEKNAGRSQLASAITRHLVGDAVFVRSVGIDPTGEINPTVLQVLEGRGIDTSDLYAKSITPRLSHRADVVVLMGIDEIPGVPGMQYVSWDIDDPEGKTEVEVNTIAADIEAHVRELLTDMGVLDESAA